MANYYGAPPPSQSAYAPSNVQNLQFYPSSYGQPVSGHATPSQASYGYGIPPSTGGFGAPSGFGAGFGGAPGVSGRMGEQGGLRTGWLAALSTEGYEGEPPLLVELGVNFSHIQAKTLAVLNPFSRIDQHLMDDSDLAGPILFFVLFGTFLLVSGHVHFGYIYGLALFGSACLHFILSLMTPSDAPPYPSSAPSYPGQPTSGPSAISSAPGNNSSQVSSLTFARSASVLGYCLLPLVGTSLVGIVMSMDSALGICLTLAAIMWCTYSASGIFCAVLRLRAARGLVAYPLALFYVGFGIMSVFSSRGSGSLGRFSAAGGAL
ncbi:hypothetical protein B0T17DRAFT_581641 [Bombardia bombarda]|uniref:Protein YIP n=1 Tax=Bombardia bombarda TaxID=252184 RepID=A0AA39WHV0_9PEZI|nr:hypothetical protein B0T17DRAFT_581641 [Bombardia bombarda]